ncbi:manganese efflux pump MntP family protein [Allofournierella sp.]|uniref:manganese efflux pump MntP n=1 Tax=Allofournierella sp. TaxID=1940256 RepID=UPI003AB5FC72
MSFVELFVLAVGLSMDALAVSICKGLSQPALKARHLIVTGLYFGVFQALMPLLGWLLGAQFERFISGFDHWVVFILLGLIGLGMIRESREKSCPASSSSFGPKAMFPLAVATSIDALAAGVSLALLSVDILWAILLIGLTTFFLSALGVWVGHRFGARYKSRAELAGGIVLILMGTKILLQHLGVLPF